MVKTGVKVGDIFGRLTVVKEVAPYISPKGRKNRKWLCKCTCGNTKKVVQPSLKSGLTVSCGCFRLERLKDKLTTERKDNRKLYNVWCGLRQRCNYENHQYYKNYGGRGISVCPEWDSSFSKFYKDMGADYKEGLQIDRIDPDGNYCPDNCRWVTPKVNARNKNKRKGTSSTYRGVSWHKVTKKWSSTISLNGKSKHLGVYPSEVEAARVYDTEASKHEETKDYLNFK